MRTPPQFSTGGVAYGSRGSNFFIDYKLNGELTVNSGLLSVVLHD